MRLPARLLVKAASASVEGINHAGHSSIARCSLGYTTRHYAMSYGMEGAYAICCRGRLCWHIVKRHLCIREKAHPV